MPKKLTNMEITTIALVGNPANKRKFMLFKSESGEGEIVDISKPYPNEHACRLRDPGDFKPDSFRRVTRESDGKKYSIVMGRLKGETTMTEQTYRYPKDTWSADSARSHCKDHKGTFEAAQKSEQGGDEMEKSEELEQRLSQLEEVVKSLTEEVEKKGAVLSKKNLELVRQMRKLCSELLVAAGVEKGDEKDDTAEEEEPDETPPETEEKEAETAEQPVLTEEKVAELSTQISHLPTEETFRAMLNDTEEKEVKTE